MQGSHKGAMTFETLKVTQQEISGEGLDEVGEFDIVNGHINGS